MKYREDEILDEIKDYISGTYDQHYSTNEEGFQVMDMIKQLGIDKDFCQANAIKYLCRYGKKDGYNRKDLLKAIHYIVLLLSGEDEDYVKQMEEDAYNNNKKEDTNDK
jgi:hypothetical protein|tara:strand:+ start:16 stop:339 length:324 start_codon:yes stop_codon:yes gene_type:complete